MSKNDKSKFERYAMDGGNPNFHHIDSGGVYGTHEGDKKEGSHAPDLRIVRSLGSSAELLEDDAERWLRKKDSDYENKGWNG